MWRLLNNIRSQVARPIRRVVKVFVRPHPETGEPMNVPVSGEETSLSDSGNADTVAVQFSQSYDCGHSLEREFGGKCFECGGLSCNECHCRCSTCKKPLDPRCDASEESEKPKCGECNREERNKRLVAGLLSPFVILSDTRER